MSEDFRKHSKFGGYQAYEPSYNPRVHGPYIPSRYYGEKPRVSFWNLKLGNIPEHFWNSDKSGQNIRSIISKSIWRIGDVRFNMKKSSFKPLFQFMFLSGMVIMYLKYPEYAAERRVKYHW